MTDLPSVGPALSIVVPAFNAEAYLGRALSELDAVAGVEVIVVDDGSTDATGALADDWAARRPATRRVIHQPNRGHGGAINAGVAEARGAFVKILDADDWLDIASLARLVRELSALQSEDVDAVFTDFVHERVGKSARPARFDSVFPSGGVFEWADTERFGRRQVLMMHAIVYRTELVRASGLRLPEHTFYVDNLYVVTPLARVRRMRYLPIPLYRYHVGRPGQSVAPEVMVRRVEQQLRVNRLALAALPSPHSVARGEVPAQLYRALLHHVEGVCAVTSATLARAGTADHLVERDRFWREVRAENPWLYTRMRRSLLGAVSNLPGQAGRRATSLAYDWARRVVGFS
ncbi:glycosyltransferase family 2 protein [Microbacterium sp. Clip185]|uniref:glycosyltransferase family 2 protein n=1 Tax=Microbacterium sp. Clip185 TaxID=3025663 RepID=UPI002365B514|nr:glycosyltransferase family A protein [Microbacterium sp. Clip185]WDG19428.1 glycosyltransferase family A protein [Microbacterium sp. Clip185]